MLHSSCLHIGQLSPYPEWMQCNALQTIAHTKYCTLTCYTEVKCTSESGFFISSTLDCIAMCCNIIALLAASAHWKVENCRKMEIGSRTSSESVEALTLILNYFYPCIIIVIFITFTIWSKLSSSP